MGFPTTLDDGIRGDGDRHFARHNFGRRCSLVCGRDCGDRGLVDRLGIIDQTVYRMHKRAARPDEIAALRFYSRPGTWPVVRHAADDWRRSWPKLPITLAMILRWEGEAVAKIRAAMPYSNAEQAAAQAQAFAFK